MHQPNWIEGILIPGLFTEGRLEVTPATHKIGSITVKPVTLDGFMAAVPYRVEVDFLRRDGASSKVSMIVKRTANIPEALYEKANFDALFGNEIVAYTEVIPLLTESAKYPKMFYAERQEVAAVCLLDDFSRYGWKTSKYLFNLPLEYLLLAVREIAGFHGEMYALKHAATDDFKDLVMKLKESRWSSDEIVPAMSGGLKAGVKRAVKVIKEKPELGVPTEFLNRFLAYTSDPLPAFRRLIKPREPLATICHGDYLRNNIAFKYENEQPVDVMMYDFQTMLYTSPMIDLGILLHVSAFHEVRYTHFDAIFQLYHDTLVKRYCGKRGIPRDQVPGFMSKDDFLREYFLQIPYAMMISGSFVSVLIDPQVFDDGLWEVVKNITEEDMEKQAMTRGGKVMDDELRHQMYEFYQLSLKYGPFEIAAAESSYEQL